ncbi:hypothetical protein EV127DRAFT_167925 [Xylaria flabelliformis]|nr:hypothetical protein EV127DRAFT_167925 [Xylaria flabelliformis]
MQLIACLLACLLAYATSGSSRSIDYMCLYTRQTLMTWIVKSSFRTWSAEFSIPSSTMQRNPSNIVAFPIRPSYYAAPIRDHLSFELTSSLHSRYDLMEASNPVQAPDHPR